MHTLAEVPNAEEVWSMCKQFGIHVSGPLEPFVSGFLDELARQGYSPWSATSYLVVMRHLSCWLGDQEFAVAELTPQRVQEFVAERRACGYAKGRSTGGMVRVLINYLSSIGAIPEVMPRVPEVHLAWVLDDFTTYLLSQRGLAQGTIHWYRYVVHRFLSACGIDGVNGLEGLTTDKVTTFILAESRRRGAGSLNNMAVALRAFLRFLYLQGHISLSLEAAVLPAPGWRDTGLSRALSREQVAQLLASCDRHTNTGRRNFAIMTMLARLGLRSKEVASLTLDDVDWRSGEILVAGKGNRYDRLPLPVDVGEALADYCHQARPDSSWRAVFLHIRAPYAALSGSSIHDIVKRACVQAGLPPAGAHRLRHSAATAMRRAGAPLLEIGQVLRHGHPRTTAHYAKDDLDALAGIARQWPGGGAI